MRLPGFKGIRRNGLSRTQNEAGTAVADTADVEISLERFEPKIGTDLGWVSEPSATVTKDAVAAPGTMYSGSLTLPPLRKNELAPRYRLVVREYEKIPVDREAEPTSMVVGPISFLEGGRRLVYADQVEI
ncbi:MAG TPA: hypothetical protein VMS77_02695 [Conexivisphaerales archaeon]|nr:hypothetical protein [Conexivisphaerales archaeon]